jgi:UDP-N-acetylmuramoyl-tripeptide--D-alanyl-D-alanine ligase
MWRARRARARSRATFIGVTGSSGKSTAAGLLGHLLAGDSSVYSQVLANTIRELVPSLYKRMNKQGQADYVIFEAGAHAVGSIRPMAEMLQPHVAIITMVRLEHLSSFRTLENVAREKRALVEALRPGGLAILNADDPHVLGMAAGIRSPVVTFGMSEGADYRISDVHAAYPERLSFVVNWKGNTLALKAPFPADYFWLPTAAAVTAALELGVLPETVAARLATYVPLQARCEIIKTGNGPEFIVDTAKSPWHSVNLALGMLARATAGRKRIVLGQISDYAGSNRKYGTAYQVARQVAHQVIYVGDNAHRSRAGQDDRESGRFREIRNVRDVSDFIKQTGVPGELILLKSSTSLHLERVALAWGYDVKCWVQACGKPEGCQTCGLYEVPFEQHSSFVARRRRLRRKLRIQRWLGIKALQ